MPRERRLAPIAAGDCRRGGRYGIASLAELSPAERDRDARMAILPSHDQVIA